MTVFDNGLKIARYLLDPRQDIELFGMYGAANLGDEAMELAGLSLLPKGRAIPTISGSRFSFNSPLLRHRHRRHFVFGGGTLIHGGSPRTGNAWLEVAEQRLRQGSALAFFGTGITMQDDQIEARTDDFLRWSQALAQARKVAVRGPVSQRYARAMGIEAECFGDACFGLFDPARVRPRRDDRLIAVNFGNPLAHQAEYEALNARMLAELGPEFRFLVLIVTPKDREATARILAASGITADRYRIVEEFWNPAAYIEEVSACRAFIGLKLHAAGLSWLAGVPSLLFRYKEKCLDFVSPIGLEEGLLDLTMSQAQLGQRVDDLLSRPERFVNVARIAELKASQQRMIDGYFNPR